MVIRDPLKHVLLLEETMEKYGFIGYEGEWWHYTDEDSYDYVEIQAKRKTQLIMMLCLFN